MALVPYRPSVTPHTALVSHLESLSHAALESLSHVTNVYNLEEKPRSKEACGGMMTEAYKLMMMMIHQARHDRPSET